jgi:hypothetical protein
VCREDVAFLLGQVERRGGRPAEPLARVLYASLENRRPTPIRDDQLRRFAWVLYELHTDRLLPPDLEALRVAVFVYALERSLHDPVSDPE